LPDRPKQLANGWLARHVVIGLLTWERQPRGQGFAGEKKLSIMRREI